MEGVEKIRVLVTGATGFVGQHLCRFLHSRGYVIRATIRRSPSPCYDFPVEWLNVGSICEHTDWTAALMDVDYVVHLAALAHQTTKPKPASAYRSINQGGTASLASAVAKSKVRRLIYISSIGAVCTMSKSMVNEDTFCMPDTDYGRSKRAAEVDVEKILSGANSDYCILRPTLVYGVGNPGNMSRLIDLIKLRLPLPLGSINNRRSVIYVENLVDAIESCLTHPHASRQIFNVCDDEKLSTPELIREISHALHRQVRLFSCPVFALRLLGRMAGRRNEIERLCGSLDVDSSKIRSTIGWRSPISLQDGIARTMAASL